MTCMHSSLITYFLTDLHTQKVLSTFICTKTTFTTLSNTYPISGYSTKPDSVYSLDFTVMKQREKKKSYVILTVIMQVINICHSYCYHAGN